MKSGQYCPDLHNIVSLVTNCHESLIRTISLLTYVVSANSSTLYLRFLRTIRKTVIKLTSIIQIRTVRPTKLIHSQMIKHIITTLEMGVSSAINHLQSVMLTYIQFVLTISTSTLQYIFRFIQKLRK